MDAETKRYIDAAIAQLRKEIMIKIKEKNINTNNIKDGGK